MTNNNHYIEDQHQLENHNQQGNLIAHDKGESEFKPLFTPKGNGEKSFVEFQWVDRETKTDETKKVPLDSFRPAFQVRENTPTSYDSREPQGGFDNADFLNNESPDNALGELIPTESFEIDFQDILDDVENKTSQNAKPPANYLDAHVPLVREEEENQYDVGYADGAMEAGVAEKEKYERNLDSARKKFSQATQSLTENLTNINLSSEIKKNIYDFCLSAIDFIYVDFLKDNLISVISSKLDDFEASLNAKGVDITILVSKSNFTTICNSGDYKNDNGKIILSESRSIIASREVSGNDFTAVASFGNELVKASMDITDTANSVRGTIMNILSDDVAKLLED
ncbi:hypothetical protein [Photobacterium kishitanii]|uniref:Uncharacterized protein n=1 Tax=Photobacterium kishitanii TaxID=318456 RepID=A0A2T3KMX3_9GAMM|nr:hypothetical protein [Photobacterium kishitanii]PSV01124.1 hypothetical protein C9J27_03635 [Photobacterium kishitanii]